MSELNVIREAFANGTTPPAGDPKKFGKLLKKYVHLLHPKFVHFYPVRDCFYDDTFYRVYAMPVREESISEEVLEAIKAEIDALPLGSIRFNAGDHGVRDAMFDEASGQYICKEEDIDDVMAVSNRFDGVLLYTAAVIGGSPESLDAHYAVYGKWDGSGFLKWDGETIIPVTNSALGKASSIGDTFVENPDAPEGIRNGVQKYMQLMQYVLYAMLAVGAVWYLFFR